MKIVVLDYLTGSVRVEIVPDYDNSYDIEHFLRENCNLKVSQIEWMATDNESMPVYYGKDSKPRTYL